MILSRSFMKVHVISENQFIFGGTGVHTAFFNHIELLKEKDDIEVVINGEGTGDVFHSHTYLLYYFWKGRKYKGRRVLTAHVVPDSIKGSFPAWRLLMPFVRWGLKKVYSYADVCIAISPKVKDAIIKMGAKTKIVSISNPINVDLWKRTEENRLKGRHMLGLSDSDFVVLGVGQLMGGKGVEDFIEIAETINEAKFVWAGGRPLGLLTEGKARINKRFKKAGERVISTGQLDLVHMPFVYASADLMLFPSYHETFGLAPLEAAACGMPVIYRDLEEYRLLYKNPYLKARDINEFISLTKRMIHDKDFYNEGLKISAQLLKQFDKNNIRGMLISLYESLINN
jgi:1,2-diacylglycerol-3-alpha-glucose alpha-1,2-galactosyltransferase